MLVNVLFIISDLDDKRNVKDALQPLREDEGHTVAHVERVCRGPSTSVQVERLALLVGVQNLLKVALAEENAASDESMRLLADRALQSLDQLRRDREASVLVDQFVIVDTGVVLRTDLERRDDVLTFGSSLISLGGSWLSFLDHK